MANGLEKVTIGHRIKELMFRLDKNQSSFAESIGYSQTSVYNTINDKTKPGSEMLAKILAVYPAVNKEWLISGVGNMFSDISLVEVAEPEAENSYLMEAIRKIEHSFKAVVDEQKEIIKNQRFIIDTLQNQLSQARNFNAPATGARVVELYNQKRA